MEVRQQDSQSSSRAKGSGVCNTATPARPSRYMYKGNFTLSSEQVEELARGSTCSDDKVLPRRLSNS
ncbi:TPA: hypothetical protein ACH3X3_006655 [Trebouxia sp. C0006]